MKSILLCLVCFLIACDGNNENNTQNPQVLNSPKVSSQNNALSADNDTDEETVSNETSQEGLDKQNQKLEEEGLEQLDISSNQEPAIIDDQSDAITIEEETEHSELSCEDDELQSVEDADDHEIQSQSESDDESENKDEEIQNALNEHHRGHHEHHHGEAIVPEEADELEDDEEISSEHQESSDDSHEESEQSSDNNSDDSDEEEDEENK